LREWKIYDLKFIILCTIVRLLNKRGQDKLEIFYGWLEAKTNYMLNLTQELKTKVCVFDYESNVASSLHSNNLIFYINTISCLPGETCFPILHPVSLSHSNFIKNQSLYKISNSCDKNTDEIYKYVQYSLRCMLS
jgi:hypothetical protein